MGAKGLAWFKVGEDGALESPLTKFLSDDEQRALRRHVSDATAGDVLLLVADEWMTTCEVLGQLRNDLGRPPVYEGPYRYVWIVDFPMFVGVSEDGRPKPAHHTFTHPHPDDLDKLEIDPMSVRSQAYDLVLNGWELGSGSIRIHDPALQQRVFNLLGIDEEEANRRFGFFLTPFRYGAPPHGGFAFGMERLVAILAGEENIREIVAFPKTQSGLDPDDRRAHASRRTPTDRARPAASSLPRTDPATPRNLRGWPRATTCSTRPRPSASRHARHWPTVFARPGSTTSSANRTCSRPGRRCARSSRPIACRR